MSMLSYDEPVFRPPGEAEALILQATLGCSWNSCRFCEMYKTKRFVPRPPGRLFDDACRWVAAYGVLRRIFLADGDPLALPADHLGEIVRGLRSLAPVARISAYASTRNLHARADAQLADLRSAGLSRLYVGIESGDDAVLRAVDKGETAAGATDALLRARAAGFAVWLTVIVGLAGRGGSAAHAAGTADVLNRVQPEYLSTLMLEFHRPGAEAAFSRAWPGWEPLDHRGRLGELRALLSATSLQRTLFRADHASNWLPLRGTLGRDLPRLLATLEAGMQRSF